jgi:hypothetical protein
MTLDSFLPPEHCKPCSKRHDTDLHGHVRHLVFVAFDSGSHDVGEREDDLCLVRQLEREGFDKHR